MPGKVTYRTPCLQVYFYPMPKKLTLVSHAFGSKFRFPMPTEVFALHYAWKVTSVPYAYQASFRPPMPTKEVTVPHATGKYFVPHAFEVTTLPHA